MRDQAMVDRYLDEVDAHLHVDRAHRRRVLDEIQGHLDDAVEAHLARGADPDDAVRQAIAEVGPPDRLAMAFSPSPGPTRSVRGWRRWMPLVVPALLFAGGALATAWHLTLARDGVTTGLRIVVGADLRYTAAAGVLTAGAVVAIRRGDRDPSWRWVAWSITAVAVLFALAARAG